MILSRFNELGENRSASWTILARCIAVVWRWLSQVNRGSGRLRTMCPSSPIIVGAEVLFL